MGASSHSQLRKSRHHLPTDETTTRDSRGKGPVYGSQHGEDSIIFHSRKDVILSSLTTLTIDIQKILQSWTAFQHQLAVTAETIIEA